MQSNNYQFIDACRARVRSNRALTNRRCRLHANFVSDDRRGDVCRIGVRQEGTAFAREYVALENGREIPRDSKFVHFLPFVKDGIIRVRGRTAKVSLPFDARHQILLRISSLFSSLSLYCRPVLATCSKDQS